MKIGELAQKTGMQVETVRYYEKEGLLPRIGRTDSNYRVYSDAHVRTPALHPSLPLTRHDSG